MSSSYRSNRLGLSHWDPYAVRRGCCLELYYCNMMEWFWWDSSLISTTNWFPSVLWHCWFGHMASKNCPRNDLLCVEWLYTLGYKQFRWALRNSFHLKLLHNIVATTTTEETATTIATTTKQTTTLNSFTLNPTHSLTCKWTAIGTANQKNTPNVLSRVTSSTKPGRFWWNFVLIVLSIFATDRYKCFPPHLNNASTLPCET